MRIGTYLTLIISGALLGGLALAGFLFLEHRTNSDLTQLASSDKLFLKDIARLSDGVSVVLLNTDQILGADNEFIISSTKSQFTELIKLCNDRLSVLQEAPMTEYERQVEEYNRKVAEYEAWQAAQGSQPVVDSTVHE